MSDASKASAVLAVDEMESFNLQVVSPSAGVNEPLYFPRLPASTTVKQLKEKIREALPMRPSDEHQRLIHQGRLLASANETMLEILGQDKLKNVGTQTLHLVLRPAMSEHTAPRNVSALPNHQGDPFSSRPPPPSLFDSHLPPPESPQIVQHANANHGLERTQQERAAAQNFENRDARIAQLPTPPGLPLPAIHPPSTPGGSASSQSVNNPQNSHVPQPANRYFSNQHDGRNAQGFYHPLDRRPLQAMQLVVQQLQQEHERFHREHIAQEAHVHNVPGGALQPGVSPVQSSAGQFPAQPTFQDLIAQNQRERAAMGMHGAQQINSGGNNLPNPLLVTPPQGLRPQQQTRTRTHETAGPNGERWLVTVNETTTVNYQPRAPNNQAPPHAASPLTMGVNELIQNIMRSGNRAPSMQLPAGSLPADLQPTFSTSANVNRPASAPPSGDSNRVINPMTNSQVVPERLAPIEGGSLNSPRLAGPEVYILSSPAGPQALLVTPGENGMQTFFTPQPRSTGPARTDNHTRQDGAPPNTQAAAERRLQRREARAQRQIRLQAEGPNIRPVPQAHLGNAPPGRVVIHLWPHIWLIIRLIIFVWFFATGENRSWYQFITVTGLAVVVFVASIGIFNGIADQVWAPFRRHLERLVPLAAPNIAHRAIPDNGRAALDNANADAAAPRPGVEAPVGGGALDPAAAEPHPAEAAARLIEQRRQLDGSWLWTQIRRAEHATILFLASLIPGVGERHIAARAAEENLLLEAERLRREVGAAAERVVAVEQQLRAAMGEMVNVATGVAALNTRGARAEPNVDGRTQPRERTENDGVDSDENAAARPEYGTASAQATEEAPEQPLIEL